LLEKNTREKKGKKCMGEGMVVKRAQYSHVNLINELRICPKDWQNYLRMDEDTYMKLLSLVTPFMKKNDTVMRRFHPMKGSRRPSGFWQQEEVTQT